MMNVRKVCGLKSYFEIVAARAIFRSHDAMPKADDALPAVWALPWDKTYMKSGATLLDTLIVSFA